jgi:CHASE1-domain containing sensor protein
MYKKQLLSLGINLEDLTPEQKTELNQIQRQESNYRLCLASDEDENELLELETKLNARKKAFESTLSKKPNPDQVEESNSDVLIVLGVLGTAILGTLFFFSGVQQKN